MRFQARVASGITDIPRYSVIAEYQFYLLTNPEKVVFRKLFALLYLKTYQESYLQKHVLNMLLIEEYLDRRSSL